MTRLERDIWRVTLRQTFVQPRVAWSNFRFLVGMRIGGFKTASR